MDMVSNRQSACAFFGGIGAAIAIAAACLFCHGCTTGVTVVLKDSSGINVGSISFQESMWPIVSYFTGPTFRFWAREGFDGKMWVKGSASLTNSTRAFGIYESTECKNLDIDMFYNMKTNEVVVTPWKTNAVESVAK